MFKYIEEIYYWFSLKWDKIRWFSQRFFRGYDDTALWDFDYFILQAIRKPFKAFVKYTKEYDTTIPSVLLFDSGCKRIRTDEEGMKMWIEILEQIEEALDLDWVNETDAMFNDSSEGLKKYEENLDKIQKGWELLIKYRRDLWS